MKVGSEMILTSDREVRITSLSDVGITYFFDVDITSPTTLHQRCNSVLLRFSNVDKSLQIVEVTSYQRYHNVAAA